MKKYTFCFYIDCVVFRFKSKITITETNMITAHNKNGSPRTSANNPDALEPTTTPREKNAQKTPYAFPLSVLVEASAIILFMDGKIKENPNP